jgi:hypothetical protein
LQDKFNPKSEAFLSLTTPIGFTSIQVPFPQILLECQDLLLVIWSLADVVMQMTRNLSE